MLKSCLLNVGFGLLPMQGAANPWLGQHPQEVKPSGREAIFTSSKVSTNQSALTFRVQFPRKTAGWSGVAGLLALWLLAGWTGFLPERLIPRVDHVATRVWDDLLYGGLLSHLWVTLQSSFIGFVIGVVVGTVAAVLLVLSDALYRIMRPYISLFNSVPRVALAPLFIIWFGIGLSSRIALAVSLIAFIQLISVHQGLSSVDPIKEQQLRILGAKRRHHWLVHRIPHTLPYAYASIRVSAAMAILASVAGEMIISTGGLGWLLRRRGMGLDLDGMFSVFALLGSLGLLTNAAFNKLQERTIRW